MGSCPLHACLLTPGPWLAPLTLPDLDAGIEPANRDLLTVDGLSLQAVTCGMVRFECGASMSAAVYVRFLRSLIEELFCRRSVARIDADTLAAIWQEVGCQPYVGLSISKPFERLTLEQRRDTLRAVGRLFSDLPSSLQRRMPAAAWGAPFSPPPLCARSPVSATTTGPLA